MVTKNTLTDQESLELGVLTTKASLNEVGRLEDFWKRLFCQKVFHINADKGYQSKKNAEVFNKAKTKKLYS